MELIALRKVASCSSGVYFLLSLILLPVIARSWLLHTENQCYIALTSADGGQDTGTDGKKDALQVFAALQTEDDKPKETILVASTQASR